MTDDEEVLVPRPLVESWNIELQQEPCGLEEAGTVILREVSLAYNHTDLLACAAPEGTEFLYKITEGHGQDNPPRYFVLDKAPYVDRIQDMGWVIWLRHVETICP